MKVLMHVLGVGLLASSCAAVQQNGKENGDDKAGLAGLETPLRHLKKGKYRPSPTYHQPEPTYHKPEPPSPTPYKPPVAKGLPKTRCPSAIVLAQPHPGLLGKSCFRGAACQTRFETSPGISHTDLIGNDILSIAGSQAAYQHSIGLQEFMPIGIPNIFWDKVFGDFCTDPAYSYIPYGKGVSREDNGDDRRRLDMEKLELKVTEMAEKGLSAREVVDEETRKLMQHGSWATMPIDPWYNATGVVPGTGLPCFIDTCLQHGTQAFHFLFTLNKVPFQKEFVDICTCILTGGIECGEICSCHQGEAAPNLPGQIPFCDCYCACCHE